jgi:ppGpp synthetase/RelA/SpoT-type nucleotidyltranferase
MNHNDDFAVLDEIFKLIRPLTPERRARLVRVLSQMVSVHYVLAWGRNVKTCEIQVRTLSEEVWGEIDHSINYPHPIKDVACTGQLETLAAAIMNVTTNVDSIVRTVEELKKKT